MDAIKRKTLAGIIISCISQPLIAAESEWECRVSADGSSWDCYKDGNLVMQPMPQATAPVIKPATPTTVPDTIEPIPAPETIAVEAPEALPEPKTSAVEVIDVRTAPEKNIVEAPAEPEQISDTATTTEAEAAEPETAQEQPVVEKSIEPEIINVREKQQIADDEPLEPTPEMTPEVPLPEVAHTPDTEAQETQDISESPDQLPGTFEPAVDPDRPKYCNFQYERPVRVSNGDENTPTYIDADDAILDDDSGIATFTGNVILIDSDQKLIADTLKYNTNTEDVEAEGNLSYQGADLGFVAESVKMNLESEAGLATGATYKVQSSNARGDTGQLQMMGNGITVYKNASYTTCEENNNDWVFNAGEVTLDDNTGVGTAKDMQLFFLDTPVLYLPWATFPIDDRRKSGFLTPSIGSSESTGFDVSAPYYFNLAPNYDATVTPRIMSDRGFQLGGEFRYLDYYNRSVVNAELMPEDQEYLNSNPRSAISLEHTTKFTSRLVGELDINAASDQQYFEDLGGSLASASTRYLKRNAQLRYAGSGYTVKGQMLQYQVIDENILKRNYPYKILPRMEFSAEKEILDDVTLDLPVQYTNFDHSIKVDGHRLNLQPSLTYNWNRSWGFIKPKGTVQYTTYSLDGRAPGLDSSIDRTTATFSLDSGLIFERNTSWFGNSASQTLEPRAFYVYTPEEDQDNIPLFDTRNYLFGSDSLFRENHFSGPDRVADANQLTLAVSSRYLSEQTGNQFLGLTLGQVFYFEDRQLGSVVYYEDNNVQRSITTAHTNDESSYVAVLDANPTSNWSLGTGIQWNADLAEDLEKAFLRVKYLDDDRRLFSARYQFDDRTDQEYTKVSAYWPIAYNTRLVGHSYYSIEENRAIESVAGIEHGRNCCWRMKFLVRDYQADDSDENNLTVLLQLELRGFTSFGEDIDSFLEDTIEGFVRE